MYPGHGNFGQSVFPNNYVAPGITPVPGIPINGGFGSVGSIYPVGPNIIPTSVPYPGIGGGFHVHGSFHNHSSHHQVHPYPSHGGHHEKLVITLQKITLSILKFTSF